MNAADKLVLFIAEGFGSGRLKPGPGTWGSVAGLAITVALLHLSPAVFAIVALALIAISVPVCSKAERLLNRHDPGSVVLDEIVAMPLTLLPLLMLESRTTGPRINLTDPKTAWPWWLGAFVLFRILDIWKPWPIRNLQHLNAGLGVVMDDVAAGLIAGMILAGAGMLW